MTNEGVWNEESDSCRVGNKSIHRIVDLESIPFAAEMIYPDATPSEIKKLTAEFGQHHFDLTSLDLLLSFHSFLVQSENHTILVDLCCGNDKNRPTRQAWHKRNGPFLDNLAKTGVQPRDIDFVMCTHLHADHVGWNTQLIDGAWVPTFPNAQYLFAEKEFTHWQGEHEANPPEPILYGAYIDSVLPVMESGQALLVKSNHDVGAGIRMEAAYGHTPGNVIIHIEDQEDHAILCGDAIHHPVQLAHPEWSTHFCSDPEQSQITRMAFLADYADTKTIILPAHFQAPDYGRIESDNNRYRLGNS
jgi:glyoxylase-like metal-dependent hydrolase (beta-lactamase superfamily II)